MATDAGFPFTVLGATTSSELHYPSPDVSFPSVIALATSQPIYWTTPNLAFNMGSGSGGTYGAPI